MTTDENVNRTMEMWERLGASIQECAHSMIVEGDVERAVKWAMYADACFYQATGEAPGQTITELLSPPVKPA